MSTIKRRIHFYNVELLRTEADDQIEPVAATAVVKRLHALTATPPGADSRYMPHGDDELLMEIADRSTQRARGIFAVKRSRGIPRLEKYGKYRDIRLAQGEGLAEARHFVLWPRTGLLGIEVNGRGPTMSALRDYIVAKCQKDPEVDQVKLSMRLSSDQFDVLARTTRISSASVSVYRNRLDEVSALDAGLHRGLRAIAQSTNALEVSVEYRLGDRRRDASLTLPWRERVPGFLSEPDRREALAKLKMQLRDEDADRMRQLDLLEDRFVGEEDVVETRLGVVDSSDMFRAIEKTARSLP